MKAPILSLLSSKDLFFKIRICLVQYPLILGDVTTVNLTYMSGGVQMNVVPNEFTVGFDIRITPTTNMEEFEAKVSC